MINNIWFNLDEEFLETYKERQPKWGFSGLGYVVYKRTYARPLPEGGVEEYWQTLKRVTEGVYTIQKRHCSKNKLPWDEKKAQFSAQRMYQLMWEFKFTPPGRGLWMMGTNYVYERGSAALNNCAFTTTENIDIDFAEPFCFLADMSMLGVGVGADTKGADKFRIRKPQETDEVYVIPDTREGWVEAIRKTLMPYQTGDPQVSFDYSKIRPYGSKITGFGGTASGSQPLVDCIEDIKSLLDKKIRFNISSGDIVDIFNLIGKCVVSGNVRRSASILFGDPDDEEFLNLKNPEINKEALMHHRWASNNSIFARVGMDYSKVAELTAKNGEPGYVWLQNAKDYSRMGRQKDHKDYRARGVNPCSEQTLEPHEICCLVETYPSNHETLDDWLETLNYAYLYAKTVTLLPTHDEKTNSVMMRNRRIGCSVSGITQAFKKFGRRNFFIHTDIGYQKIQELDKRFSDWMCIPKSIKTTSVKPSGTVSLLAGVTPGIHYPISEFYIRNVRFGGDSPLLDQLKKANYKVEKDKYSNNTFVVSFPVKIENFDKSIKDVTMWEQLENTAQVQKFWADNQVSVTISFDKEEAKQIKNALELYETRLKGVSFLPIKDHGYEQAPYIEITKEDYEKMVSKIKPLNMKGNTHEKEDKYCNTDMCEVE